MNPTCFEIPLNFFRPIIADYIKTPIPEKLFKRSFVIELFFFELN